MCSEVVKQSINQLVEIITRLGLLRRLHGMEPLNTVLDTWRSFAMRFSAVCFAGVLPSSCRCKSIYARKGEFLIQSMTVIFLEMATI